MSQPDLFDARQAPEIAAPLVAALKRCGCWRTARQLAAELGLPNTESGRRILREMAAGSSGMVGSGQNGYRLVVDMSEEEYQHAVAWIESQATEMYRRAGEMRVARTFK